MSSTNEDLLLPPDQQLPNHYSLRWNNHQNHILQAFEALLHAELLVDVTLVCAETSLKAHKVVLSVCSPFFERIFAEHPCKHPVIVLKDFPGSEISPLLEFMYRGEVRVNRKEIPGLMRAAESLQVRGLVSSEPRPASPPSTPASVTRTDPMDMIVDDQPPVHQPQHQPQPQPSSRSPSVGLPPTEDHRIPTPEDDAHHVLMRDSRESSPIEGTLLFTRPGPHQLHPGFLQHHHHPHNDNGQGRESLSPLMPRRKQARPRRRSGELQQPQDLSSKPQISEAGLNLTNHNNNNNNNHNNNNKRPESEPPHEDDLMDDDLIEDDLLLDEQDLEEDEEEEEVAENLSMRRATSPASTSGQMDLNSTKSETASSLSPSRVSPNLPRDQPPPNHLHPDASFADIPAAGLTAMSALALTPPHHNEYLASLGQFAAQWLPPGPNNNKSEKGGGGPPPPPFGPFHPHHPVPSESPLGPRGPVPCFPLDGAAGLFPGPLDLHDPSFHGLFPPPPPHPPPPSSHHRSPGSGGGKKSKKSRDGMRRWSDRGIPGLCRPKGQHSAPRGGPPRSWTNADLTEALTMVWNKKMTTSQASRIYGIPYNSLLMYVRGKYGKSLKLEELRKDCVAGEVMNSLNNNVKSEPTSANNPNNSRPPGPEESLFPPHPLFFPDFGAAFPVPVNMVHLLPPSEQNSYDGPPPLKGEPAIGRSPSPPSSMVQGLDAQPQALVQHNGAAD